MQDRYAFDVGDFGTPVRFVDTFDRGRATSLHLFEHVHGDSRDRGPAMVDLGQMYERAGLVLGGLRAEDMLAALPVGIALALVVGKPIGIVAAALAMRATGWARFPDGMDLRAMIGLGLLCGIGFTMSLFIASLAYGDASGELGLAKVGILTASVALRSAESA